MFSLAPRSLLLLGMSSLLLAAAPVPEKPAGKENWRMFRGNAQQTGIAEARLPDKLDVLWTFKARDSIEGAVVVADGVVYATSFDEYLYAIDLQTGKEKWKYKAGPATAAPAVLKDQVIVGNLDGLVTSVDVAKGTKRWSYLTGGEIKAAPTVSDEHVLVGCYGDDTLYCLTATGKLQWKFRTEGPVNGSVAVAEGHTFVAGCDSMLRVLSLDKGKEIRAVDLGGQCGAGAAVLGDHIYVGTMTNEFLAIDWKKGKVVWDFTAPVRAQPFYSSAAVTRDRVVVGSRDRRVHAFDRKTGKQEWSHLTRGSVDSSPVIADGRIYVGSFDGFLYVLDLAKGNQIEKINLRAPISASPAIAANRVLIGNQDGVLYCFGKK
jgi:outer membrane protein assembly factor BamB